MEDRKLSRHRTPEDVRRQKRKELDARRSKSRIRLGTHLDQWCNIKDQLGFHLHSDFAKFLLDSYTSKSPESGSGPGVTGEDLNVLRTSSDALRQLVVWAHDHSQECGFIPDLKSVVLERTGGSLTAVWECIAGHSYPWLLLASAAAVPDCGTKARTRSRTRNRERAQSSSAEHGDPPEGGHYLRAPTGVPLERTIKMQQVPRDLASESSGGSELSSESDSSQRKAASDHERLPHGSKGIGDEAEDDCENSAALGPSGPRTSQHPSPAHGHNSTSPTLGSRRRRNKAQECSQSGSCEPPVKELAMLGDTGPNRKHSARRKRTDMGPASGLDTMQLVCESDSATDEELRPGSRKAGALPETQAADRNDGELEVWDESDGVNVGGIEESTDDDLSYADDLKDQNYSPSSDSPDRTKRKLQPRLRGRPPKEPLNNVKTPPPPPEPRKGRRARRELSEEPQIPMKKIRKKAPKEILRCEFEGCGKIVSNRQYLKHHMKYQHLLQKTFACSHPSCGRSFNFKKHLKEHEKLHSDKRDYICEFCARAFRTTSNLIIHRRIHTGEKPLQCEICGFTCRQKASLNWHMKKHDAESGYQFSCDICGKKFEKKDNVNAHKSKSHPETPVNMAVAQPECPVTPGKDRKQLELKPEPDTDSLQCEICGIICRQRASLNWHMKKHDAEPGYQFSCDICGKKFEKKDNVNAHKSKSHPETPVNVAAAPPECPATPGKDRKQLELKPEPETDSPRV
ncbi:zinc finger protein 692-like [Heterodontus francisci]|uniref:zinc finger protein 692-like n=1 Tax=Heterodontus francisci TaxID=7792 RepID=UPI00355B6A99